MWQDPKTHVVTIVAWGGVGKTALVVDWMARMAGDDWRGAERVFDWSFYSQGTSETTTASADAFVAKALEFFGDPDPKQGSPWDKGERLAHLVAELKTLLVLDGVEPLQHPPGPVAGKLKDPALEALLMGLAQHNGGLCLVTTREAVTDLAPFRDTTAPEWRLEQLSEEAGAQLLFRAGVTRAGKAEIKADDQELKDAARKVGGHALTLQLLGRYLAKAHKGDVRKRGLVGFEKADARIQGGHAFHVMGAYEKWLGGAGEEGKRQLAVLHLLGLFDRPADSGCLAALRREPAIAGLTEPLVGLDDEDWNYTLSNLVECGIISAYNNQSAIDCHPLVREYFGKQLREKSPDAWRETHRRLYEHLKGSMKDKKRPTIEDLQPLCHAVVHGCLAGLHREVWSQVYFPRVVRRRYYVRDQLGALTTDMALLSCFFARLWDEPVAKLTKSATAYVLFCAGLDLRMSGRLTEAVPLLEAVRRDYCCSRNLRHWAARAARHLAMTYVVIGDLKKAQARANEAITLLTRRRDSFDNVAARAALGTILYHKGKLAQSEKWFKRAERLQKRNAPIQPLLFRLQGYRYCELLLALGQYDDVLRRCRETQKWREQRTFLVGSALNRLVWAKALFSQALKKPKRSLNRVQEKMNQAILDLRATGQKEFIVRGLLSRASLRFVEGDADGCRSDLDEAWQIAERGSMRLHMADVLLYKARLFRDKAALAEAAKLIDKCGYHRRDEELADAEACF
ncbi:MAG TPA: tetratricopeptide repeat protein [Sedimentisphaerales bacterium]|nr:tetratricopeptide repeat protein [Sedimentisphaerales bacterium]